MEKEKNNAIEKAENLTKKSKPAQSKRTGTNLKKSAYKPVNEEKSPENDKVAAKSDEKKPQKKQAKGVRAAKKNNWDRKKRLEEKKARRAAYRMEKLKRREERLARRDKLKHEGREEKKNRLLKERQAKLEAKKEKREQLLRARAAKNKAKEEKRRARRAAAMEKRRHRAEEREKKRNRGIGGWLAAVISLASAVLILGTLFTLNLMDNAGMTIKNSAHVAESFYALTDYVDNMDVNISKLLVSKDQGAQQKLLLKLTVDASLAAEDFTRLPLKDEQRFYTSKFINQVADFSTYLSNKLSDGGAISEDDKKTLSSIYATNRALREDLASLSADMGEDFDFNTVFDDNGTNIFLEKFVAMESRAVDYPKLIYDGPFSDIEAATAPRALSGDEITPKAAEEAFLKAFSHLNPKGVELLGEKAGKIACYELKATGDEGELYASISKVGGKVIMFNYFKDCDGSNVDLDTAVSSGEKTVRAMGIEGLTPVWATENANTAYINLCYNDGGIVCYRDMVKITVCRERGVVSAFDATAYYLNHTARRIEDPKLSARQAVKKVSPDIEVTTPARLVLIPFGNQKELLSYEVSGTFDGATYYVYIDAATGNEAQILRAVETTEGTLIM